MKVAFVIPDLIFSAHELFLGSSIRHYLYAGVLVY